MTQGGADRLLQRIGPVINSLPVESGEAGVMDRKSDGPEALDSTG